MDLFSYLLGKKSSGGTPSEPSPLTIDFSLSINTNYGIISQVVGINFVDLTGKRNITSYFKGMTKLKDVPILDLSNVNVATSMFYTCASLTDQSLDNILVSLINISPNYARSKTLSEIGLSSVYYPANKIQALPHYQDFINAGWTIGY